MSSARAFSLRWVAAGILGILVAACSDQPDSTLAPSAEFATVPDSVPPQSAHTLATTNGGGIVLPERALVRVTLLERNAAWWHALSVVSPENRLLAGPGYLFPGPSFDLGPYEPGIVVLKLDAYNPRSPHQFFGTASQQISGTYPSWQIGFEDGADNDFDDIIIGVEAIAGGGAGLEVACDPADVVRGDIVRCTASAEAGSSLDVLAWSFVGDGGETVDEASDANPWQGALVVGGKVTVTAEVDGVEGSAETTVTVTARDWSSTTTPFTVSEDSPGPLPATPVQVGDLGKVGFRPAVLTSAITEVPDGPNAGLHYLSGIPYGIEAIIHVNTTALKQGSQFWQWQPRRRFTDAAGIAHCSRADVVPFQAVVRNHEGSTLAQGSHARFYRDKLDDLAGPALEDIVAPEAFAVLGLANPRFEAAMQTAQTESAKADDAANRPSYCLFTY